MSTDRYAHDFSCVEQKLPGQKTPWVAEIRKNALAQFMELGFPSTSDEEWKYTKTSMLARHEFSSEKIQSVVTLEQLKPWLLNDSSSPMCVCVDGQYKPELSNLNGLPEGVEIGSIASLLQQRPEILRDHLLGENKLKPESFYALNTAFMADGIYLNIPKNVTVTAPIQVLFITSDTSENKATYLRNLWLLGENSQATIFETYASFSSTIYFNNIVTEISLKNNAQLTYYQLQEESHQAFHIAKRSVNQARDSQFRAHTWTFGGSLSRSDLSVQLNDEGAFCDLSGLYIAGEKQHIDQHTRIDHKKPHGKSREYYKGIISGQGRAVFDGKVMVHQQAQKTDAQLTNQNLLLSPSSEIDTKPQLEIYADDVKCNHGATVGQLDEQALFYLRSRGIDMESARSLLVHAFANDRLDSIEHKTVRQKFQDVLSLRATYENN
jgi:Fe-S cluster assembly protein SufD